MKRMGKRITKALVVLVCMLGLLTVPAAAQTEGAEAVSLRLQYVDEGRGDRPLAGLRLTLYRVADVTGVEGYRLTPEFSSARVDLTGSDAGAAAETLCAFAQSEPETVEPAKAAQGETDEEGSFFVPELLPGLYLVTGETLRVSGGAYTPVPFLLALPQQDSGGNVCRDVSLRIAQKLTQEPEDPSDDCLDIEVKKVWRSDDAAQRPEHVTVLLLRNGERYASAELNEQNGWYWRWNGLSRSDAWMLAEEVPAGYTVLIEKDADSRKITFTVTNTGTHSMEEPPTEGESDETPPPAPQPPSDGTPDAPDRLPQTGMLWQPVELLAAAGAAFLLAGWHVRRRSGTRDDNA